jgi:hypothetical protein
MAQGKTAAARTIRIRYQSRWSHCAVIDDDDIVHESVFPDGVIKTPLEEFKARYGDGQWEIAHAYAEPGWRERAESLVGLKYDFFGALGIGFGTRRFDHPDRLWCSHHTAIILGTLRPDRLNRLAPEHIWIIANANPMAYTNPD